MNHGAILKTFWAYISVLHIGRICASIYHRLGGSGKRNLVVIFAYYVTLAVSDDITEMELVVAYLYDRQLRRESRYRYSLDPLYVSDEHVLRVFRFPCQEIISV